MLQVTNYVRKLQTKSPVVENIYRTYSMKKQKKSYFRWIFRKIFSFSFLASPGKLVPLANWQSNVFQSFPANQKLSRSSCFIWLLFNFHVCLEFIDNERSSMKRKIYQKSNSSCWSNACRSVTLLLNPITFFQLHSISLSSNMIEGPTRRRFVQCRRFLGSCIDIVVCLVLLVCWMYN